MTRMLAYGRMKRLAGIAFTLAAFAAPSHGADAPLPVAVAAHIAPGKLHEECLRLEAGDKRRYHWKANAAVDFNIHYHRGDDVFYPVKREGMRGDGGTF